MSAAGTFRTPEARDTHVSIQQEKSSTGNDQSAKRKRNNTNKAATLTSRGTTYKHSSENPYIIIIHVLHFTYISPHVNSIIPSPSGDPEDPDFQLPNVAHR